MDDYNFIEFFRNNKQTVVEGTIVTIKMEILLWN